MAVLTKIEKEQVKIQKKITRCKRLLERQEVFQSQGYQLSEAKQLAADEEGISVVQLYNLMNWYKQQQHE